MHPLFNQTCQQWMAFMNHLGMYLGSQLLYIGWGWAFLPGPPKTIPYMAPSHLPSSLADLYLVMHPMSSQTSLVCHWSQGQHQHYKAMAGVWACISVHLNKPTKACGCACDAPSPGLAVVKELPDVAGREDLSFCNMLWGYEAVWETLSLAGGRRGGMPFLWWDLGLCGCPVAAFWITLTSVFMHPLTPPGGKVELSSSQGTGNKWGNKMPCSGLAGSLVQVPLWARA